MGWEERDTYGDNHAGDENGDIEGDFYSSNDAVRVKGHGARK